jgi:glutaredoxin
VKLTIAVTRTCPHCRFLKKYFEDRGIQCEVKYLEECPDYAAEHDICRSPNLLLDGHLVASGMPSVGRLNDIVQLSGGITARAIPASSGAAHRTGDAHG